MKTKEKRFVLTYNLSIRRVRCVEIGVAHVINEDQRKHYFHTHHFLSLPLCFRCGEENEEEEISRKGGGRGYTSPPFFIIRNDRISRGADMFTKNGIPRRAK